LHYKSTRDNSVAVTSAQAIVQGISRDGGLFVPERLPVYTYKDLTALAHGTYAERAEKILGDFLEDFTRQELCECVHSAYETGRFDGNRPAPLSLEQNGDLNMYLLELWHGPTCAFKDMALQILPHLLTKSMQKVQLDKKALILVATSGDTGKAALEGFRDVAGTRVQVFYPKDGVSAMQERQMRTQEGDNVAVCAIEGNFDDAQSGVKKIFADESVKAQLAEAGYVFSSANSINWGRLVPQIVYYFSAYCDLMTSGEMDYEGEKVNIVVPTGNFGNILAAYYAMKMGLPVNKLICASNANNVLTDFLRTGIYDRNRPFHTTISPSMDILISSNLERLLYSLTDSNAERVAAWMESLTKRGRYQVDEAVRSELNRLFFAGFCDDAETQRTIRELYQVENYLCDPHTAVAVNVYQQYAAATGDRTTPAIIASTASPYKFASSVLGALLEGKEALPADEFEQVQTLSAYTGTPIPAPIAELEQKPLRFDQVCAKEGLSAAVLDSVR